MDKIREYQLVEIVCSNDILFAFANVAIILVIFVLINYCYLYSHKESVPFNNLIKCFVLGSVSFYLMKELKNGGTPKVESYETIFNQ